ncbi:MAG TPA: SAM-dependent DNA methyltransferase [Chromatiaceae bacterium]|nr:SAM-dependent DNA methyltransferase [Chromatiaceae bacterium]
MKHGECGKITTMTQLSFFKHLESTSFSSNKQKANGRKLRGGYYTPLPLAEYLVQWGVREDTKRVLEPSCGDGNFVLALLQHQQNHPQFSHSITAVELQDEELEKAKARAYEFGTNGTQLDWIRQDFFEAYTNLKQDEPFDLVVGNPPFIRFQYFNDDSRNLAFAHLRQIGYKPTKLANAWAAFVQLSVEMLKENGRMAMVLPAELLQVKYAHELREKLANQFAHIFLVGFQRLVFPEIQQEVVLLLAEGKREANSHTSDIHTIQLPDGAALLTLDDLNDAVAHVPAKHTRKGMKWTSLFLDETAFAALDTAERAPGLTKLGQLAEVDVGIVTGRNKFFVLDKEKRDDLQAADYTIPIVGRTTALKTTVFNQTDFTKYTQQYPAFLLNLKGVAANTIPQPIKEYVQLGEQENIHRGYKCRIRKRWYDVPSIFVPDAFLFRQIHRYPLLVLNEAGATSTDTVHRVRFKGEINGRLLATVFFNSLTLAWAEVCGRSYGGGVLELEPREAEELPIPYDDDLNIDVEKVETLLRNGRALEALDYVDNIVLKEYLGFDDMLLENIRSAWEQLRDRRINRK